MINFLKNNYFVVKANQILQTVNPYLNQTEQNEITLQPLIFLFQTPPSYIL